MTLVAGGNFNMNTLSFEGTSIEVFSDDQDWPIAQSPFMHEKAKTTAFALNIQVNQESMEYQQTSYLDIYGKSFEHTDTNKLIKY